MLQRIIAPFRVVTSGYARINAKSPFIVSCTSAGIVAGIGDGIMQKIEGNKLDPARVARMMVYRAMFFAPSYALWLRGLEKMVPATVISVRSVATKVALEQVLWGPPALGLFYVVMSGLEGMSVESIHIGIDRAKALLVETIKVSVCFWTPMQAVTFSVIPMQYRVLWVSVLQVGWNAWLSSMNQTEKNKQLRDAGGLQLVSVGDDAGIAKQLLDAENVEIATDADLKLISDAPIAKIIQGVSLKTGSDAGSETERGVVNVAGNGGDAIRHHASGSTTQTTREMSDVISSSDIEKLEIRLKHSL